MRIFKTRNVKTPNRGTPLSAGIDFYVPEAEDFQIKKQISGDNGKGDLSDPIPVIEYWSLQPGESILIPAGIKTNFSKDYAFIAFNKSGIAAKNSVIIGASVIDADYQGEIHIDLKNVGNNTINIYPGDKITQFILVKVDLSEPILVGGEEKDFWMNNYSERGQGGFGHTDKK